MRDIECPFPYQVNPFLEQARERLVAWTARTGLLGTARARERFDRADFGWFAAMVYPTADEDAIDLMVQWFAWLFLVDDQLDDGSFGRSPERMAESVGQMRAILSGAEPGGPLPPVAGALADLWTRTCLHASPAWQARYLAHLEQCLITATMWEAENRVQGRVPDEQTYIAKRRHTGAIYVCMDLIEIASRVEIPEECYGRPDLVRALDASSDVVVWVNDVYSLAKERSLGEVHNLVYVIEHHRGISEREALEVIRAMTEERTNDFLDAERRLLCDHPDDHQWLGPVLAGMRTWMRGNLDWSRRTKRYTETPAGGYLEPTLMDSGR
ncbi:terpene synthase family protein [Mangrovihabitans endophyticus]|uniref:Terpene synthase n=1 Tax=Mangrovihabitans endophyticus TaxID=1751298 RepID=A0A8J3BW57_9ACTN|nr:terpene cyclase [Mangrovihabitans endophyticus]GGK79085.1 hypothetical protein GCM10012284_11370 [Mangrovihabitans endophyticus]